MVDVSVSSTSSNASQKALSSVVISSALGVDPRQYFSMNLGERNKLLLGRISEFTALTNVDFFAKKIQERIDPSLVDFIRRSKEPIKDELGRITFFYVKIGPFKIPLHQPGSFMFESAVDSKDNLAVVHGGSAQNGPVLGMGCACFLAKFLGKLSQKYQEECALSKKDSNNFYPEIYDKVLIKCLHDYAKEDALEHGRLIEIKDILTKFGGNEVLKLEDAEQKYFYMKDISAYSGANLENENESNLLTINQDDMQKVLENRKSKNYYGDAKEKYFKNVEKELVSDQLIKTMKDTLLVKNNIFENPDCTRKQLKFLIDSLETIGGDNFVVVDRDSEAKEVFTRKTFNSQSSGLSEISEIAPQKPQISEVGGNYEAPSLNTIQTPVYNEQYFQGLTTEEKKVYDLRQLEKDYDISSNEKLYEYYFRLKLGFESILKSALIADADIFELKSSNSVKALELLGDIVPDFGIVFKAVGIIVAEIQESMLKKNLAMLCELGCSCPDLSETVARKLTILKRKYLMELDEKGKCLADTDMKVVKSIMSKKKKQNFSVQEALAIKDLKVVEATCLRLVITKELNPRKPNQDSYLIACKIADVYKQSQINYKISPDLQEGEQPEPFDRDSQCNIPQEMFDSGDIPMFLKQKPGENFQAYERRCINYLKKLPNDEFYKIMGKVDPTNDATKFLSELLLKVEKKKQSRCNIF